MFVLYNQPLADMHAMYSRLDDDSSEYKSDESDLGE